jgi:hypothetical protein
MQEELAKLELIRGIDLPADLFNHASPRDLERCRRRVAVEAPHELRRHPDAARITWLAAFVYLRARSLTDDLVDLLIETIIFPFAVVMESGLRRPAGGVAKTDTVYGGIAVSPGG